MDNDNEETIAFIMLLKTNTLNEKVRIKDL